MQTLSQAYRKTIVDAFRQNRLSKAQRAIVRWAQVDDHQALLDLSCHDICLLNHYMQRHSVRACGLHCGADNQAMAKLAMGSAEIMQGSPHDIPWRDASFDSVFITDSLDGLIDAGGVLDEIKRVLRPDGQLLIALPIFPLEVFPSAREGNRLFEISGRRALLHELRKIGFPDTSIRLSGFGYVTVVARRYKA